MLMKLTRQDTKKKGNVDKVRNGRKTEDFLNQNASGEFASCGFRTSPIREPECGVGGRKSPLSNAAIANEMLKITNSSAISQSSFSGNEQVQLISFAILSQLRN